MVSCWSSRRPRNERSIPPFIVPLAACAALGWGCVPATAMYVRGRTTPELSLPPTGVVSEDTFGRITFVTSPIDGVTRPPAVPRGWRTIALALRRVRCPLAVFPSLAAERSGDALVLHFSGVVLCQRKGGNETPFALAFVKARAKRLKVVVGDVRYFETGLLDGAHASDVRARLKKALKDSDERIRKFSALLLGRASPDEAKKLASAHPSLAGELIAYGKSKKSLEELALDAADRVHPLSREPLPEPVPLFSR